MTGESKPESLAFSSSVIAVGKANGVKQAKGGGMTAKVLSDNLAKGFSPTKTFLIQIELNCVTFFDARSIQKTFIFVDLCLNLFGRHVAPGHSSERVKAPVGLQAETDIFY